MKNLNLYTIVRQIWGKKRQNLLICVFIMVLSTLLMSSHLFNQSSRLEETLLSQTPYYIQFNDQVNKFTDDTYYHEKRVDYNMFLNTLEQIDNNDKVSSSNINGVFESGVSIHDAQNNENGIYMLRSSVIGVNCAAFFNDENIELSHGRFLTDEEINNKEKKIVIPDSFTDINGQTVSVGNYVDICHLSQSNTVEGNLIISRKYDVLDSFEIVGIYKSTINNNSYTDKSDLFDRSSFLITSYDLVRDYVFDQKVEYFKFKLSKVRFEAANYQDYRQLKADVERLLISYNKDTMAATGNSYNFEFIDFGIKSIVESIDIVKHLYSVIFTIFKILSITLLVFIIYHTINNNKYEIQVLYSLGLGKNEISLRHCITYLLMSILFVLAGIAIGITIVSILHQLIINNSEQMQYLYISYSYNGLVAKEIEPLVLAPFDIKLIVSLSIRTFLEIILTITVVVFSTFTLFFKKLKSK